MEKREHGESGIEELLKTLADTAENVSGEIDSESKVQVYYQTLAEKIETVVQSVGITTDKVNFSFNDLVEVAVLKEKTYPTVLQNIQETISALQKYTDDLSEEVRDLLNAINTRAESLKKALLSSDSSTGGVTETGNFILVKTLDQLGEAEKALKDSQRKLKNATKKNNETLSTVLTVLGIFVAIIIAIVAVYLNGVADKNTLSLPLSRQLLISAFRWHATFLLIFFLIFLIAKLTGRSLAGMCKEAERADESEEARKADKSCDCSVCLKDCGKVKQIRKRFPWFILMNGAFFAVELAALFVEIVGWSKIKDWLIKYYLSVVVIVAVVVVVIITILLIRESAKKKEQKNNTQTEE